MIDADFVAKVLEREKITNHDVAAFVDEVQAAIGFPAGAWIHYGLTSSDVVDTALCHMMTRALDAVIGQVEKLLATLADKAFEHYMTPMLGRTHGMAAEPTTFGNKIAALKSLPVAVTFSTLPPATTSSPEERDLVPA